MEQHFIDDATFAPDFEEIRDQIRLDAYPELEDEVRDLYDRCTEVARPRAVYGMVAVEECREDRVRIDGRSFHSRALAVNLKDSSAVVAYVATCGPEIDRIDLSSYDPLSEYWISILKEHALRAVSSMLYATVERRFGLAHLSQMNPGSANVDVWPIAQQVELFALFDGGTGTIGVRLTDSYLMVPDKSVSGVLFESATGYVNCHACDRENCPNRRAPFQPAHATSHNG